MGRDERGSDPQPAKSGRVADHCVDVCTFRVYQVGVDALMKGGPADEKVAHVFVVECVSISVWGGRWRRRRGVGRAVVVWWARVGAAGIERLSPVLVVPLRVVCERARVVRFREFAVAG